MLVVNDSPMGRALSLSLYIYICGCMYVCLYVCISQYLLFLFSHLNVCFLSLSLFLFLFLSFFCSLSLSLSLSLLLSISFLSSLSFSFFLSFFLYFFISFFIYILLYFFLSSFFLFLSLPEAQIDASQAGQVLQLAMHHFHGEQRSCLQAPTMQMRTTGTCRHFINEQRIQTSHEHLFPTTQAVPDGVPLTGLQLLR